MWSDAVISHTEGLVSLMTLPLIAMFKTLIWLQDNNNSRHIGPSRQLQQVSVELREKHCRSSPSGYRHNPKCANLLYTVKLRYNVLLGPLKSCTLYPRYVISSCSACQFHQLKSTDNNVQFHYATHEMQKSVSTCIHLIIVRSFLQSLYCSLSYQTRLWFHAK